MEYKKYLKNRYFVLGLIVKLILIFIASKDSHLDKMVTQYYLNNTDILNIYPVTLKYLINTILAFIKFISLPKYTILIAITTIKFIFLAIDFIFLIVLLKEFKSEKFLLLYWCMPIFIINDYIYGNFDLFAVLFLVLAIFSLFKKSRYSFIKTILFLTISLTFKFNTAIVIPLFFIYYYRLDYKKAFSFILYFVILGTIYLLLFNFSNILNANSVKSIFDITIDYGKSSLYIFLFVFPIIYLFLINFLVINEKIFLLVIFITFFIFTLLSSGDMFWYFWAYLFLIILISTLYSNKLIIKFIYISQFLFIIYFLNDNVDIYIEYLKLNNILFSLFFTSFFLLTFYVLIKFYNKNFLFIKKMNMPYIIGISGDSGSGKSTLAKDLILLFL